MKKKIAIILVISMVFSSVGLTYGANASDLQNHWGREVIQEWMDEGFINGYPDGSFRPDNAITRAEFMVLVNKAFEFEVEGSISYIDVSNSDWYYDAIRVASASSYIEGYPDGSMKPNNPISRQEVTVILSKITNTPINSGLINGFADANEIAIWAKDSVGAAITEGYMQGYPDGTFKPTSNITRAEAVVTLNKAFAPKEDKEIVVYNKEGIYGPQTGITTITKDVLVESDGVTLQNMIIKGNLTIAEEVGTGDVYLNNVTVEGETFILGGGEDSIHIDGGNYNKIIVQKTSSGNVRIVAINVDGLEIIISEDAAGQTIILEGSFDSVTIDGNDIDVVIQGETNIKEFIINKGVKDLSISLDKEASINKLVVDAKIDVKGKGTIKVASGKEVNHSTYEKDPDKIINLSSGGSSGSSGGETPSTVDVSAISVIGNDTVVNGGTLQLGVTVTPVNANDKTVIWSVAPGTGFATISEDGLLTATALGTVTVTATNVSSGIYGTKEIIVTIFINGSQLAPTGLVGVAPTALGGNNGKITGTTTAMEYKLATDTDWIDVIGLEITGLATGTYNVRYAAREGYNAGTPAYVVISADNFEQEEGDNSYQTAKFIATDGTPQTHAIYPAGDEDWVKFSAVEGNIYQIATSNLIDDMNNNEEMDTYIELYNMDGKTLIFDNDDYDYYEGLASKISLHCSTTGTYYVRIIHYTHIDYDFDNPDTGTGSYDISITQSAATELLSINIDDRDCKYYYYVGDTLDISRLVVMGQYNNDIVAVETITTANVTGFNSSSPTADQELTVTIGSKTDTYNINIAPAHTLAEAKLEAEDALGGFEVENNTTESDVLAVVRAVIKNINITAEFTVAFDKTVAIVGTAGSVTGTITLTNSVDSLIETVIVNKEIPALVFVTNITVTSWDDVETIENGEILQLHADVTPEDATDKTISWSVASGTGTATINSYGVLRATGVGTVTVTATNAASGVTGTIEIDITSVALTIIGYRGSTTELVIPQDIVGSGIDGEGYYGDFKIKEDIESGQTVAVTGIGDSVFMNKNLTSVTIPDSVVTIGEAAFYGNFLEEVTIPEGVKTIGEWAFAYNYLTSVTIPDSVTSIGAAAFLGLTEEHITLGEGFNEYFIVSEDHTLIGHIGTADPVLIIPGGVTDIGVNAFMENSLTSVTIPDSVITIGDQAFAGNQLANLIIGDNVTTIGDRAFVDNSLIGVVIGSSVTSIGNSAFSSNNLTSVTIGTSVTSIGEYAFNENNLTSVTIPTSVDTIGEAAFMENILTSITIGPGVIIGNSLLVGDDFFRNAYLDTAGGAGSYSGTQTGVWTRDDVAISGITVSGAEYVSSVANGKTLQMDAVLTPTNATNVSLTWSVVALVDGTATINEAGLLTATGVGTVRVTATDTNSVFTGTKDITITIGDQAAPTGLAGVPPTALGESDGKITGTTIAMEYKLEVGGTYADCSAGATAVAAGDYVVRFAAKDGYNAGATTAVTVPVYVVPVVTLSNIAITTPATKLAFKVGDTLDITGMVVTGTYSDVTTKPEIVVAGDVTGFDSSSVATTQTLTVTVGGKTATYDISIAKADGPVLTGVTIDDTANTVIGMTAAMEFSTDGTTWTAYNATTPNLPDLTGTVALQVRVTSTATHNAGAATTYNFTAPVVTLSSIAITTPATKLGYKVSDTLDITGMVVTGTYSDATTKPETVVAGDVTGFDSSAVVATQILTVTVGGKTATYDISITKADGSALTGVTIDDTANTITGVTAVMEFSTDGTTWTAYNATTPNLPDLTGTVALQVRIASTATHNAGTATTFNFTVPTIPGAVITITVKGAGNVTEVINGGTLQMSAVVLPESAENKEVTWTVEDGEGKATISTDGLLTATEVGTVNVKATAKDGSEVVGQSIITITLTTPEGYFTFNAGEITDYTTAGGVDIVIPSTIGGATVTKIGFQAFRGKGLTSVVMPDSVHTIAMGAFMLNSLTNIIIPDSVTTILASAFRSNQLASVTIPNNVTSIGQYAFEGNRTLTSLIIGDSVISIEAFAFKSANLTNIAIPNSVKSIGEEAFSDNALTNVTFGSNIESIGRFAFFWNQLAFITIPASVTSLGDGAFSSNPPITKIIMERGDTVIGNSLLANTNTFRDAYTIGGAGTYTGTQWGAWTK